MVISRRLTALARLRELVAGSGVRVWTAHETGSA